MSLPPTLFYPGGRRKLVIPVGAVLNAFGEDIGRPLRQAAEVAGIPAALALACIMAESDLNPRAERWGRLSDQAKQALASGDHARLRMDSK